MNSRLVRLAATLLVPCLIADPATASSLLTSSVLGINAMHTVAPGFEQQAVVPTVLNVRSTLDPLSKVREIKLFPVMGSDPVTRTQSLQILERHAWNFRDAESDLGIPRQHVIPFLESRQMIEPFKEILLNRLTKNNWAIRPTGDQFGVAVQTLQKWMESLDIQRPPQKNALEIQAIIERHSWNLGQAKHDLGMTGRLSFLEFLTQYDLIAPFKAILRERLEKEHWTPSAVARLFGVTQATVEAWMKKFALDRPKRDRTKTLSILEQYDWNFADAAEALGLGYRIDYYAYIRDAGLQDNFKKKLLQRLRTANWISVRVADQFGVTSKLIPEWIEAFRLKQSSKDTKDLLALCQKTHWNFLSVKKELQLSRTARFVGFLERNDLMPEFKADVFARTQNPEWTIDGLAAQYGISGNAMAAVLKDFGISRSLKAQLRRLAEEDVAVAKRHIRIWFAGTDVKLTAQLLEEIERQSNGREKFLLGEVPIYQVLSPKAGGTTVLWAFARKDVSKVASYFGWKLKGDTPLPVLAADEVAVSNPGLIKYFIGMARDLKPPILQRIEASAPKGQDILIDGVRFFKRTAANNETWAFSKTDIPHVARLFGFRVRVDISPLDENTEVGISQMHLGDLFIGSPHIIAKKVVERLDAVSHGLVQVTLDGVEYFRRQKGPHRLWAFRNADLRTVGHNFGLILRGENPIPSLGSDEIAVSLDGLVPYFYNATTGMAKEIRAVIGEVPNEFQTLDYKDVRFFVRLNGMRRVWAFSHDQALLVSSLFGYRLRTDAGVMIETLGLEDALALLGDDPLRLKQYIQLYHPELAPEDVDSIAIAGSSMRGLRADATAKQDMHEGYTEEIVLDGVATTLPVPSITTNLPNQATSAHAFVVEGRTVGGVRYIQVVGDYIRKIVVRQDGGFSATLPLTRTGETNQYFFYAVNDEHKMTSKLATLYVQQTGIKEDSEAAFLRLLALKEEVLESIKVNPARYYFLLHSLEQSLLKRFTYGEENGFRYVHERIKQERSPVLREMLRAVEVEFRDIAKIPTKIKPGQHLYFFQKYTVYVTQKLMNEGARGVIIASEQGLGKTITALVIVNGHEAVIITPNAVVSTWAEQEEKFMTLPQLDLLEGTYRERQNALVEIERPQIVTNVEFTQGMTQERANALSQRARMLIVDEADYLGRLDSQQSRGTRMIESDFRLPLTATPFKKTSHIGNMLGFLLPNDPRFKSTRAFGRAFPPDKVESLNALFLLMHRYTIRIRKKDVFDEYDPKRPLDQQSDRLPRKVDIPPAERGQFFLTPEQSESIRELFTDYQAWCRKHRTWIEQNQAFATLEDRKYKRYNEGFFPKLQALRQIMNDPAYIGRTDIPSPKHQKMDAIVDHELTVPGHKVLIFCKYVAEVEKYVDRYARYGALAYYGEMPKNSNGYKIDANKKVEYYRVDDFENFVLKNGRPIPATKSTGRPIRTLDYQRIVFQNDPAARVLVATYDTGAVGVTLTAADAVIDDDLAPTYRDQYQSDDRAHRIDNDRKKYEIRYYRLQALYPKDFLDHLDPTVRNEYFGMGTYDQVQHDNLKLQGRIFHRIMDGVGDESELRDIRQRFIVNRMPFLFRGQGVQEEEPEAVEEDDASPQSFPALIVMGSGMLWHHPFLTIVSGVIGLLVWYGDGSLRKGLQRFANILTHRFKWIGALGHQIQNLAKRFRASRVGGRRRSAVGNMGRTAS